MREYIQTNLKIIKKHLKKRKKVISNLNKESIAQEFKEWTESNNIENQCIWTLPDLTQNERLDNFCRSIKKNLN